MILFEPVIACVFVKATSRTHVFLRYMYNHEDVLAYLLSHLSDIPFFLPLKPASLIRHDTAAQPQVSVLDESLFLHSRPHRVTANRTLFSLPIDSQAFK